MNMSETEAAEAIIVVGPYLWKCVNCNLLMSRLHSIDDHLVSQHSCLLKPDMPLNAHCKLSVCGCQKITKVGGDWKENESTKHTRKRKKSPMSTEVTDFIEPAKHGVFSTSLKEKKYCPDPYEKGENSLQPSLSLCHPKSKEKVTGVLNINGNDGKDMESNSNITLDEGSEVETKLCENSETESCNVKPTTGVDHSEKRISKSSGKSESDNNKCDFDEVEEQSRCTRKSSRSNKGKNSLYSEFEMRIS